MEIKSLVECIVFIDDLFKNKIDKGGKPYVDHLRRVLFNFQTLNYFAPEYAEIAAYAHDLKEDIKEYWKVGNLLKIFDKRTADLICLLTHEKNETYSEYIDKICNSKNYHAYQIKLSDLKDNMDLTRLNNITDKDIERIKKYHKAYIQITNEIKKFNGTENKS